MRPTNTKEPPLRHVKRKKRTKFIFFEYTCLLIQYIIDWTFISIKLKTINLITFKITTHYSFNKKHSTYLKFPKVRSSVISLKSSSLNAENTFKSFTRISTALAWSFLQNENNPTNITHLKNWERHYSLKILVTRWSFQT